MTELFGWVFIIGILLMIAYSARNLFYFVRRNVTLPKIKKFFSKEEMKKRSEKDKEVISMILLGLYLVTPFGILKSAVESLDINAILGIVLLLVFYAVAGFLFFVCPKILFCLFLVVWVASLFYAFDNMETWQFILSLCLFVSTTTVILYDYINSNKDKEG